MGARAQLTLTPEDTVAIWRASILLEYGSGKTGANVWHLRTTGIEPADTDAEDLMQALKTYYEALEGLFPGGYAATFLGELTQIGTPTPTAMSGLTAWTSSNTGSAAMGPLATGMCVTWRSTLATRRGRGRTFHSPGAASVYQSDGTLTTATLTTLQSAADALISSSEAVSNGAFGVWSQTDQVLRDFVSATVNDQAAVLRSRRT